MKEDFFEELESFGELSRSIVNERGVNLPLEPTEKETTRGYIRTLDSIGRRICPEKPLCAKTVRKLIRKHDLPATKRDMGWMARGRDLETWMERIFIDDDDD
ncbi:MAG: helix-turn-helix domain-containing protein [Deltaproteobacteria bacterium]|nr:helix-turn-helix domain-containing protein [Deltaproteobacteria bacterium]